MQASVLGEPAAGIPKDVDGAWARRGRGRPAGQVRGQLGSLRGRQEDRRAPRPQQRVGGLDASGGFAQTCPRREAGSRSPGFRRGLSRWRRTRGAINTRGTRTPVGGPGRRECRPRRGPIPGRLQPRGLGVRVQRAVCVRSPGVLGSAQRP